MMMRHSAPRTTRYGNGCRYYLQSFDWLSSSAVSTSWITSFGCSRTHSSSNRSDEVLERQHRGSLDSSTSKSGMNEKFSDLDPLEQFFRRRQEMLEKQKLAEQQRQQQSVGSTAQRNMPADRVERRPLSQYYNNVPIHSENRQQQPKQQTARLAGVLEEMSRSRQEQQQQQQQGWRSIPRASSASRNRQTNQDGHRFINRRQQQPVRTPFDNGNRNNGPLYQSRPDNDGMMSSVNNSSNTTSDNRTSPITDLIQRLRKNGGNFNNNSQSQPSTASPTTTKPSFPSQNRTSTRQKYNRGSYQSSWRQKFQQNNKEEEWPNNNNSDSNNGNYTRNIRNNRNNTTNRVMNRPRERTNEDFLSSASTTRLILDDFEEETTTATSSSSSNNLPKTITLPNTSLTIPEISRLFRIKVGDIEDKLRAMGEVIDHDDEEEEETDDSDNSNDEMPRKRKQSSKPLRKFDVDTLELLALEFGLETERSNNDNDVVVDSQQLLMQQRRSESTAIQDDKQTMYPTRPPIVCILGHVDHGKTTLMDALRRQSQKQQQIGKSSKKKQKSAKTSSSDDIAGTEAGGITQIISAFQVALDGYDDKITFLDTPGHAAFKSMRQSGSHAADVIVLVIAADDGISEQTVEIIDFYKSIVKGSSDSGISMVVALNKIDKPGIDVKEAKMRIENQLLEHGIISEGMNYSDSEYGQPVQVIPTSGLTGQGLDDLMEGLMLQSEIMDLRADNEANAEGIVMDARMEKGLGVVADCIIRWGKIQKGDVIISGDQVARVRMLKDVNNKMLNKGSPSQPVRIIGFKSLPKAGYPVMVVESEELAEEIVEKRLALDPSESDRPDGQSSDIEIHIHGMRRGDTWRVRKVHEKANLDVADGSIRIPIIVKADADGTLFAVRESLVNLGDKSKHNVVIDPISEGIGEVTPSDIQMAKESEATIFTFGVKQMDQSILNLAESEGVDIYSNDIIYSLLDEAKEALGSYLPTVPEEHVHGRASVQAIFTIDTADGKEKVAGLKVIDGHIYKSIVPSTTNESNSKANVKVKSHFRIIRDGEQISPEGETITASSLRRFKELVDSVRMGDECGLALSGFDDFEEGDEIECYSIHMKKASL